MGEENRPGRDSLMLGQYYESDDDNIYISLRPTIFSTFKYIDAKDKSCHKFCFCRTQLNCSETNQSVLSVLLQFE